MKVDAMGPQPHGAARQWQLQLDLQALNNNGKDKLERDLERTATGADPSRLTATPLAAPSVALTPDDKDLGDQDRDRPQDPTYL